MGRFLHATTLLHIEDGKMLRRNMRMELITTEELMAQLRENGIENCAQVKRACIEADGRISIIKIES
ncbi:YetF domain-containing protein [Pseudomonas sp. MDT1-17]